MAAQSPIFVNQLPDDLDNHQIESIERRRAFVSLVPFWFDDFEDFYHSDSEQSADVIHPIFSVDHAHVDIDHEADDFSDASDLVDNFVIDSGGDDVLFDRENQVNFVRDLFQDRVEQQDRDIDRRRRSGFGVVDGSNYLDLDLGVELGLGLGLSFADEEEEVGEVEEEEEDDVFFGSWRMDGGESMRVIGSRLGTEEADIDSDESDLCSVEGDEFELDVSENLFLDSLQLEEEHTEADEELEWEEVRDGGIEELERDGLTMLLHAEGDDVVESVLQMTNDEVVPERIVTGWEVLLNSQNVGGGGNVVEFGNEDMYFGPEGYFNADEYETVFGQFADNESGAVGKPPAAKASIENLETVVVTQVDVESNTSLCAVCKDEMPVGGNAKKLPCSHSYHGDCIIPWLGIRNTCPVCRFELPTDDPAYERRRTQRASNGN